MRPSDADSESLEPLAPAASHDEDTHREPPHPPHSYATPEDLAAFARTNQLDHKLDIFHRAALLIQGDSSPDQIDGIRDSELAALRNETHHKWQQPKIMYLTITCTALGAMGQGWAQTSMNGANLYFPKAFGIEGDTPQDNLILGLINSGIYLSNGLLGAWLVAPLNKRFGRRGAVFWATVVSLLTNIGGALTQNWQQLLFFRLVLGCALGIVSSTLNVYAAECAPAVIRGGLAVSWQMFCAFGIFVGFVANVLVYDYGPNTWRIQLAGPFLTTLPLLATIYMCPESPAWLIKHGGRWDRAYQSLAKLRNTELQAARELYLSYLQRSTKTERESSYFEDLRELFTVPRIRRVTQAAYAVMICQQLCGINIISFYSSTIFADANFSTFGALMASTIFGFVNWIGAFPAVWTMDTLGRRSLLLLTLPFMALTMFAAASAFSIPESSPARLGLLASMIYLFCAEYSPGMGPVPAAYAAEVFPLSHREIGMSSAVAVTNIWASVLSLTFPQLLSKLGSQGAFASYALLNIVAVLLVFLFVPETRLKTLEELDGVFSISTRKFIRYQLTEYVPWWTRRYVMREKERELPPLEQQSEYRELEQEEELS